MNDRVAQIITSVFGLGYFPFAAGSLASALGALPALYWGGNIGLYLLTFAGVTALGFLFSPAMERVCGEKDPSAIVIDEVSGAMIAFFMLPMSWPVFWTAFFVFRAFDMFKIYPASALERKPGGVGVMSDDLVAGVYTNLIMQVAVRAAGII